MFYEFLKISFRWVIDTQSPFISRWIGLLSTTIKFVHILPKMKRAPLLFSRGISEGTGCCFLTFQAKPTRLKKINEIEKYEVNYMGELIRE